MSKTPIILAVFFAVCLLLLTGCDEMFGEPIFRVSKACFAYGKSHCEGNTLVLTTQDTQCRINTTRGDCDYGCIDEKSVGRCLSAEEQARRGRGVDFSESKRDTDLVTPACRDGFDNDGDGPIDMADPGCSGPGDTSEADEGGPYCGDGTCNGGETHGSCPADCPLPPPEISYVQCNNSRDDDGDGKIDYANDYGCSSPGDNSEDDPSTIPNCVSYYRDDSWTCVEDVAAERAACEADASKVFELAEDCRIPCSAVYVIGDVLGTVGLDPDVIAGPLPELAEDISLRDELGVYTDIPQERVIAVNPALAEGTHEIVDDEFVAMGDAITAHATGSIQISSPTYEITSSPVSEAAEMIDSPMEAVVHNPALDVVIRDEPLATTGPCCARCVVRTVTITDPRLDERVLIDEPIVLPGASLPGAFP